MAPESIHVVALLRECALQNHGTGVGRVKTSTMA